MLASEEDSALYFALFLACGIWVLMKRLAEGTPNQEDIFGKSAKRIKRTGEGKKSKSGRHDAKPTPQVAGSNWKSFKSKTETKRTTKTDTQTPPTTKDIPLVPISSVLTPSEDLSVTKYLALDCEMVGVGDGGERSILAQICIVNWSGNIVYLKYVKPKERVTDYRTEVSGIRPEHLKDAVEFEVVQREVAAMVKNRILVGHALRNDLKWDIRDTAVYKPLRNGKRPQKLRTLARKYLGVAIQTGEHSPAEDCQAALLVFRKFKNEWERTLSVRAKGKKGP